MDLMSSPELILKQAKRWLNEQNNGTRTSTVNIEETKKEIAKLKEQEDRYAKAYGAGAFSIDKLKDYTLPLKDKIALFNKQLVKSQEESKQAGGAILPPDSEIEVFAQKAVQMLKDLNFSAKKVIVSGIID